MNLRRENETEVVEKKQAMISMALDIPDVRTLGTEATARGDLVITVESSLGSAIRRPCGRR